MSGYKPINGAAPDDERAGDAWDQIMEIAKANAMIVQAYGGVATLAMPAEQRSAGIRNKTLRMGSFELESEKVTA